MLDDEELVGPLQEVVDRRAHRSLGDVDEHLGIEVLLRSDEERLAAALVVGRDRDELEDAVDVGRVEAGLERRSEARLRTRPCAQGHALIPVASTPTARRVPVSDAAAIPHSVTISCVARPVTGVRRWIGHCARIHTSALSAPCRSTTLLAMCSASTSTSRASPVDDELDRLLEELGEPRHVDALLVGGQIDGAVDHGGHDRLGVATSDAHSFLDAGDARPRERERDLRCRSLKVFVKPRRRSRPPP